MRIPFRWTWPRDTSLQYCAKVAVASLFGYLLSLGDVAYAVYGAFSAALIVGASRGEDVGSAMNRVRGSLAGMVVGVVLSQVPIPPALAVALGIGGTAYLCMGSGWGISAARIGASLCAVTVLMHRGDALDYTGMRTLNTLIGIAAGLLVSYLVLPVRGQDAMARSVRRSWKAVAELLAALESGQPAATDRLVGVIDSLSDLEKTLKDAGKEFGGDPAALRRTARHAAFACLGALTAALAQQELQIQGGAAAPAPWRGQAGAFGLRAGKLASNVQPPDCPPDEARAVQDGSLDAAALQALALGLRKIEHALETFERAAAAREVG